MKIILSVLRDFFKHIASIFSTMILLIWVVGSGCYLVGILGTLITAGQIITISELDGLGSKAINTERVIMVIAAIFWLYVIAYTFISKVKEKRSEKISSC